MMNKKVILALTLVLVLGVGAGMGTMALYQKSIVTNANSVTAAAFNPSSSHEAVNFTTAGFALKPATTIKIGTLKFDNLHSDVKTKFTFKDEEKELLAYEEVTLKYYYNGNEITADENGVYTVDTLDAGASEVTVDVKAVWAGNNVTDIAHQDEEGKVTVTVDALQVNN